MVDVGLPNRQAKQGEGDAARPVASSSSHTLTALTTRPARKQATHREVENLRQTNDRANQAGLSYNIWYNKWSGGDNDDGRTSNTKATTRVNIARDAGYTRGNANGGAYICLFFARGYCPNGADCSYLHTLPADVPDQGHDVFGREKHGNFRDDMGGVGTIQRVNRTLYVGRIVEEADSAQRMGVRSNGGAKGREGDARNGGKGWDWSLDKSRMSATEKVLYGHFSEFGTVERVRVLHTRGCGFVTFAKEVDAQFAKEAMMHQSLNHDECINLRWATDDPNPVAQKRDRLEREREGIEAMKASMTEEAKAAGQSLLALEGSDGALGADKRRRIEGVEEEDETTKAAMDEEEYQRLVEENKRNWEEIDRQDAELQARAWAEVEGQEQSDGQSSKGSPERAAKHVRTDLSSGATNFFSAKSIEALQAMRDKKSDQASLNHSDVALQQNALGTLADYGSDSEEEG